MGMSLFEIDSNIRDLLDALLIESDDDGVIDAEIDDSIFERIAELNEARDAKIENIALYIKECDAESKALKAEADKLKKRADAAKRKSERLRDYLSMSLLDGVSMDDKVEFNSTRCKITFRSSKTVVVPDIEKLDSRFIKEKIEYSADKTAIKEAIESGSVVDGAYIQTNRNIQIK